MRKNLAARVLSGSFWSILSEVLSGGARAISYFIYAKLLSPTDFGLIGFSLLLIGLFPLLIDNSLSLTVIRQQRDDQHLFSTIFFINVGLSIVAIVALCIGAKWSAQFLHDRRVATILPILSIQLLFGSLCSVHIAIARRRFQYRLLVPIRLISTFCSLAVGIPLAYIGYTYWALVAGSIVAALSQMILAWIFLKWRPSLEFDWTEVKSLANFTPWIALDMGITWMVISGGGLFLAFFLGAHDLGLFRLSDQIDAYVFGSVFSPLIPVLYSAFCEAANDRQTQWRLFERSARIMALVAIVEAAAILISANPLEEMIGTKWHGVSKVIGINALADGLSYAIMTIPSFMRAQGNAKVVAAIRMLTVLGQVAIYPFVARRGLQAFVIGKLCLEISIYVVSYVVLGQLLATPVLRLVGSQIVRALVVAVCAGIGMTVVSRLTALGAPVALVAGLFALCVPAGAYLLLTERDFVLRLFSAGRP